MSNAPPNREPDPPTEEAEPSGMLSDWSSALQDVAPFLDLGWRIAATIALPPLLGYALDAWLGTLPWGVLAGAALGLLGTGILLVHLGPEMKRRHERRERDASPPGDAPDLEAQDRTDGASAPE